MKYPQLKLFADFLNGLAQEETNPAFHSNNWTEIKEDSDPDNKYALHIRCTGRGLLREVAEFFGCPADELPLHYDMEMTASSIWHGHGEGNLRELADELIQLYEPFFDVGMTTGGWAYMANKHHEI